MANPEKWEPIPDPVASVRKGVEPLGVGVIGPPGSGKTRSVLRLMEGVRRVRTGPVVLIDTEGRSRKYSPKPGQKANPAAGTYDFQRIDLSPPYRSDRCLEAIRMALKLKPCAIGFDTLSDEHDGEGGYLEWHDEILEIPRGQPGHVGGNEWAAWSKPAAARKRLTTALLHIDTPLFFTFRAAEKTAQQRNEKGKTEIIKLGWMPIAPLLIVKSLDLTAILPYDSKGTPVWKMQDLPGEDFVRKWPEYLLNIISAGQLTEETGEALARWAMGEDVAKVAGAPSGGAPPQPSAEPQARADRKALLDQVAGLLSKHCGRNKEQRAGAIEAAFGMSEGPASRLPLDQLEVGLGALRQQLEGLAAMKSAARQSPEPDSQDRWPPPEPDDAQDERQPGEDFE